MIFELFYRFSLTFPRKFLILTIVIWSQILVRTEIAGGPVGPPLIFKGSNELNKPYLNYQQQIDKLKKQGLLINDEEYAIGKLTDKNIGTHSFRKFFVNEIYKDNGCDIALVQQLLQHSSVAITQRYIGISSLTQEKALQNHIRLM